MFATNQLQTHRSERAHTYGVSEEKEELEPDAQLQKRAVGNESESENAGLVGRLGDALRERSELPCFLPRLLDWAWLALNGKR
jgi:hypothetical protein